MWAFSRLEVLDEDLFSAIVGEAMNKLPRFNAQNIANTVSTCLSARSRLMTAHFAPCWGLHTRAGYRTI